MSVMRDWQYDAVRDEFLTRFGRVGAEQVQLSLVISDPQYGTETASSVALPRGKWMEEAPWSVDTAWRHIKMQRQRYMWEAVKKHLSRRAHV